MTLTQTDTDFELLFDSKEDAERACSWSHEPAVEAVAEIICLACGSFCGYACKEHYEYGLKVLNREIPGRLRCRRCNQFNKFTFLPLGA